MSLSINTNIASLDAQQTYSRRQQAVEQVLATLSSGQQINSAADNPAGLAIVQGQQTQINGDNQALQNANMGIALTQTASGTLEQLQSNTQKLNVLAVQAGNGIYNASNLQALQDQADQLTQANSQIVQSTNFNGTPLLSGNTQVTLQIGSEGNSNNQLSIAAAGLDNPVGSGGLNSYNANLAATGTINLSNPAKAQQQLSQDLATITTAQTNNGAASNRLGTVINNLQTSAINTQAAQSRIQDTDFAAATASLVQNRILSQANSAALTQANVSAKSALSLLQG